VTASGGELDQELLRREVIAAALLRRADELGGYVPWDELTDFPLPDGTRQRLVDPGKGGIWNPKDFVATLSIITSPNGPYPDREIDGGLLQYSYQKGPEGGKNLKMRAAREHGLPIIRLNKIAKGAYASIYPVYVVDDNPIMREFTLTLDEMLRLVPSGHALTRIEKAYAARIIQQRVHQPAFRARIMLAYEGTCSVCQLRHPELLDAAHIEDGQPGGDPVVPNGLSLCKIHHAAYDRRLLGISPDYRVHVNARLLEEVDGPMLRHGLQEMNDRDLALPAHRVDRPDPSRLEVRFTQFLAG
jgi:putative restriction endonuclease